VSWLILAIATFFLAQGNPGLMLVLFFLCYITYTLSTGVIIPVWAEFTATIIPQAKRGRFTGYRHFFSSGLGVLAAMLANYILKTVPYPQNFACCFLLTALFCIIAMPILWLSREVPYPKPKDTGNLRNYFKRLPHILLNDHNYSKYLITTILFSFQSMVTVFYTVYAIRKLQFTDAQIAIFTGVLMGSQAASNISWGYLADKKGHKTIIVISMLSASIAPIVAIMANSFFAYCSVFIFIGFSYGARAVSGFNILFEFAPADERATYISLTNTITAPFSGLAPILGGLLADLFGYEFIFTLSPVIGLGALFMLAFWVKEPRKTKV
jgi:MFS family permease